MRIALLAHLASPTAPTGAERSLTLLAAGLAGRGHEATLVAPAAWPLAAQLAAAGVGYAVVPARVAWLVWQGRRPAGYAALKVLRFLLQPSGRRRLGAELRRLAPDVVHVNCLPHVDAAAAARGLGLPVVWHLREILDPGPRRRWFARRLRRDATRIVAVSHAVAAWLEAEGLGDRVEVVHNGIAATASVDRADARARLGLAADRLVVGLFGQLAPHKGLDAFLDAAQRAADDVPELAVLVAGTGSAAEQARAAALLAGARVAGTLLPPQPDARDLIGASDIVALTTRTADPLPRAVLEAMAGARPVVAFDSGGTREMLVHGETGLLCPAGDVGALAAAIVALARDPARRAAMGAAGRDRARDAFSLEGHVAALERILSRAAAGPR